MVTVGFSICSELSERKWTALSSSVHTWQWVTSYDRISSPHHTNTHLHHWNNVFLYKEGKNVCWINKKAQIVNRVWMWFEWSDLTCPHLYLALSTCDRITQDEWWCQMWTGPERGTNTWRLEAPEAQRPSDCRNFIKNLDTLEDSIHLRTPTATDKRRRKDFQHKPWKQFTCWY